MLIAGTDVRDGEPQPLPIQHKALLRSVQPVGQVNGFVLLATGSEMVQTLVKEELSERIERALEAITGSAQQVVVTISEESGHDDQAGHSGTGQTGAGHAGHAGAPRHTVAGRESAQTAQSSQPSRHSQPGQATQSGHPDHRRHQDAGSWRTLEFERDARETAEFGDPAPQNTGHGSAAPAQRQPMQPQPPQNPATQGTAADLFGRGKYPLHDIGDPMGQPVEEPTLNPKYTFETFVIGPQNRFAAAAAAAVAEQPARAYNPLFISGGSGLGKTHLLHAIGHYATALDPKLRVRYVSSEEFTNDFINSVRDDAQESFKRRYRDLDILIVDDIQFLEGKEGTQEEFFHTFNALHNAGKQIIISSDKPPREIARLEERLRSRFEWGLIADIQKPDFDTRIAILRKKAENEGIEIGDDMLELIAQRIESNIRELEGSLTRVNAYARLNNCPIDEEVISRALHDITVVRDPKRITPDLIIDCVADYYGLSPALLRGNSRKKEIATARHVAVYLTREMTNMSLPRIGDAFSRDHSTIINSCDKVTQLLESSTQMKSAIADLKKIITEK